MSTKRYGPTIRLPPRVRRGIAAVIPYVRGGLNGDPEGDLFRGGPTQFASEAAFQSFTEDIELAVEWLEQWVPE